MKTRTMVDDELDPRPVALTAREATSYRKAVENRLNIKLPVSSYERDLYLCAGLKPPVD
jgi:hypothetical protein